MSCALEVKQLREREEDEYSDDIVTRGNEWSSCQSGVDFHLVQNQRNKGSEGGRLDNDDE